MDVICPECGREFFIESDVWASIVANAGAHQRGECPHCGEGMCFTCQYVPADIFVAQGVTRDMIPRPIRDRDRRPSSRRGPLRKPDYPF